MSLKNWSKVTCPYKPLIDGTTNQWTVSVAGTSIFYYNTADILAKPLLLIYNDEPLTAVDEDDTMTEGSWCWADKDTLGYYTIYVRLPDGADPDTKSANALVCTENFEVMQGADGAEVILLSLLLSNNNDNNPANIVIRHTDLDDILKFKWKITLEATDSAFALDSKICLNNQDKIKIETSLVDVCIMVNGDES